LKNNFTLAAPTGFYDSLLRSRFMSLPTVMRSFRRQIRIWYPRIYCFDQRFPLGGSASPVFNHYFVFIL